MTLTNGHAHPKRALAAGIYAPIPTFFLPDSEDLDIPTLTAHVVRLAKAKVYPLLSGSMGEGHNLSPAERSELITATRAALDAEGLTSVPIIAGAGTGSTRHCIELCQDAAAAGADATIVIMSGYFAGALAGNQRALKGFWTELGEKSPIPVMIYNYPGAAGGIEVDSDVIIELAQTVPNLCGVKLTCGNVGKLTRIANTVSRPAFATTSPRTNPAFPFLVLGGFVDFLVPAAFANGHGAITGLANLAPYSCMATFELAEAAKAGTGSLEDALDLQGVIGRADFTIAKAGIAGTKYLLERVYGYGGLPRRPMVGLEEPAKEALWAHPDVVALLELERKLSGKVKST